MEKPFTIHHSPFTKTGFTLIEIIVSAVIMAVSIAGIFSVFVSSSKFIQRSNRRLFAVNLAQGEIEKRRFSVRGDTWTEANNGINLGTTADWTDLTNITTSPIAFAYRYWVVNDTGPDAPSNISDNAACRRVYMQVKWPQ